MLLDQIRQIRISIGYGENQFTMERGSFRYDEEFVYRKELELSAVIRKEDAEPEEAGQKPEQKEPEQKPVNNDAVEEPEQVPDNGILLVYEDPSIPVDHLFTLVQESDHEVFSYLGARGRRGAGMLVKPLLPNRFWITLPSRAEEHFYGGGETYSEWDLKGQKLRIFTAEHQNSKRIEEKKEREKREGKDPRHQLPFDQYESYYVEPLVVSSLKYFIFCDTSRFMAFDFSEAEETTLYLQEEPRILVGSAGSFAGVSRKIRNLLGGQRHQPDWIYDGVIAAVQRGAEEVDRKLETLEKAGVPVTGVWCQDWCGCRNNTFGYQVMWNWRYDEELYPELPEKIRKWRAKGVRFLGYINPFIALERELYQEAHEKGYLVKNDAGEDYLVTITVFPAAMVDFTNPEAYRWYKELIKKNMIGIGLSGWMADFGEYLPTDAVLYNGEPAEDWHNKWPAVWAKLNREAIAECGMENEIFFFMRAGFTGSVRDTLMMWTGDQHVDWSMDDGIGSVIPAILSLSMSAHSDTGGYTTNEGMRRSEELLMRWEEMNVFSPVMRFHEGNQPWNNVQLGDSEALLMHLGECARLHVSLKPYLKACENELVSEALPVIRPLFYHYEEEEAYRIRDEYLLGRDILVAPVLEEGAVSRSVYLPEDIWVDFWTKEEYRGGHYTVQAPLGRIPVFVRKGAALFG